jgi:hypothetical protein
METNSFVSRFPPYICILGNEALGVPLLGDGKGVVEKRTGAGSPPKRGFASRFSFLALNLFAWKLPRRGADGYRRQKKKSY